jgi:osmotically-inducible protein OsmY
MVFKPQTFHEVPPQVEIENPTDALLEADVAEALGRAGLVDASRVGVTARGSVITLDGFVGSRFEVETAGEIAARVEGVKEVDNRLLVHSAII